jgi:hypothetical protein
VNFKVEPGNACGYATVKQVRNGGTERERCYGSTMSATAMEGREDTK